MEPKARRVLLFGAFIGVIGVFLIITSCSKDPPEPDDTTNGNITLTDSSQFFIDNKGGVFLLPSGIKVIVPIGAVTKQKVIGVEGLVYDEANFLEPINIPENTSYLTGFSFSTDSTDNIDFHKSIKINIPNQGFEITSLPALYVLEKQSNKWYFSDDTVSVNFDEKFIEINLSASNLNANTKKTNSKFSLNDVRNLFIKLYDNIFLSEDPCREGKIRVETKDIDYATGYGCGALEGYQEVVFLECKPEQVETFVYRVLTRDCKPELTYSPEEDLKIKKDELLSFRVKTSIAGFDLAQQEIELSTTSNLNISEEKLETSSDGTATFEVKGLDAGPGTITLTVSFKYYLETIFAETQEEREYIEFGPMSKDEVKTIDVTVYDKPEVTTSPATEIKTTSATVGGNVTSDNFDQVTDRGVIFNETQMQAGSGIGPFSVNLTGLEPNTTYNVKAYATNSAGTVYGEMVSFTTPECEECPFIDERDGQEYQCVEIGEQTWMAENLAYLPSVSSPDDYSYNVFKTYHVYGYEGTSVTAAKATAYYTTYGVLYNWLAALEACPDGWHLPSDAEWEQLAQYVSSQEGPYEQTYEYSYQVAWLGVGNHLKATSGWPYYQFESGIINGNGTDDFGFSGLPGGERFISQFINIGYSTWFWSTTESNYASGTDYAWSRVLSGPLTVFFRKTQLKGNGHSVRCIKD